MKNWLRVIVLVGSMGALLFGKPTEEREWISTVGSKIKAVATALQRETVTLKTSEGKTLKIPLSKLSKKDQTFLRDHFKQAAPTAPEAKPPEGLELPLGEFSGPIKAGGNSTYYIYLPKSMVDGVKPPVLFWTGSSVSKPAKVKRFVRASELTGVPIAVSAESQNQANAFAINHGHTKNCLKHIKRTLPINTNRAIFSGASGGGATSFYNAYKLKCAGALPYTGYIPDGIKVNRKIFYQVGGGARDFNRYASAIAAVKIKDRGMHRMWVGGHASAREPEAFEGLLWVYTRHIYEKPGKFEEEIAHFEGRIIPWLEKLAKTKSDRAYFWTDHLINTCKLQGPSLSSLQAIHDKLAGEKKNLRYLEAYKALADFSSTVLSKTTKPKVGKHIGHVTPTLEAAAKALEKEYADAPEISKIAREVGMKTAM